MNNYSLEQISQAMKIYYILLEKGEFSIEDNKELYKSYAENEEISHIVTIMGEQSQCLIERYNGILYLIPDEDNDFLGFSKADLKKELCRSNANDKDYYLSQFVILTLISTFYNSSGKTSKSRSFIRFGDFMNLIGERLKTAEAYEDMENLEKGSGVALSNILERWNALKGSDTKTTSKTFKEGFLLGIIKFLQSQNLFDYIEADDMIKPTRKMDNFMDWNILNRTNYENIVDAFEKIEA